MRTDAGRKLTRCAEITDDPALGLRLVLSALPSEIVADERAMREHVYPTISPLQLKLQRDVAVESVQQFGPPLPAPDISLIIPLYGRIDLLELQIAQFIHDPELHHVEIVYVLDSPDLAEALKELGPQLYDLYGLPFKVLFNRRNSGYSASNNLGASHARGRLLVLLNSDVFPDRPGWLGKMASFYVSNPRIGALGTKLLYEDDSIQHAGMYFARLPKHNFRHLWANKHYFKGFHRRLPEASISRSVPAVTGACLMIDRGLYEGLGGLQTIYVQGDFEDSDLCLRLLGDGYEAWHMGDVELFHLEAQSYPDALRQAAVMYNCWLHTHLHNERIHEAMARHPNAWGALSGEAQS